MHGPTEQPTDRPGEEANRTGSGFQRMHRLQKHEKQRQKKMVEDMKTAKARGY